MARRRGRAEHGGGLDWPALKADVVSSRALGRKRAIEKKEGR
jgi:hypothetical protein